MISVITPTVRPEGLEQVLSSLKRQTHTNYEWIVISPLELIVDPSARFLKDPPKNEGDYWTFNKAMNRAIEEAKGELVVSIQDFTSFSPRGLEKFWYYFTNGFDRALVSGVGDKYEEGKRVWSDPRKRSDQGTFYECYPNDVEFNYCSIPRKAFYEVGGFDEELDKYAGMDHISVQERLDAIGYKFYLDQTNETKSATHGRLPGWEENLALRGPYQKRKQQLISEGKWPVLEYLSKRLYNMNENSNHAI